MRQIKYCRLFLAILYLYTGKVKLKYQKYRDFFMKIAIVPVAIFLSLITKLTNN